MNTHVKCQVSIFVTHGKEKKLCGEAPFLPERKTLPLPLSSLDL